MNVLKKRREEKYQVLFYSLSLACTYILILEVFVDDDNDDFIFVYAVHMKKN
jgi:hypothetical protein